MILKKLMLAAVPGPVPRLSASWGGVLWCWTWPTLTCGRRGARCGRCLAPVRSAVLCTPQPGEWLGWRWLCVVSAHEESG